MPRGVGAEQVEATEREDLIAQLRELRVREAAAGNRADTLSKSNEVMRRSIEALTNIENLKAYLVQVLRSIEEACEVRGAAVFLYRQDGRLYMDSYVCDGISFDPSTDPQMEPWHDAVEWTEGFREIWQSLSGGRGYWYSDTNDPHISEKYRQWHSRRGDIKTLCVPLVQGDKCLGFLGLSRPFADPLGKEQLELVRSLAQQVMLAVEVDRIATEAREGALHLERRRIEKGRAEELARVNSVLIASMGRLSAANDLRDFLGYVLAEILRVTGATNVAVTRYDAETNKLQLELFHDGQAPRWGLSGNELALWAAPYDANITPAFQLGMIHRHIFVASMLKDQTELPIEKFALPGGLEWMDSIGASDAAVSILFVGDEPVGTFHLHFTGGRTLRPEDLPLLNALSQQTALAFRLVSLADQARAAAVAKERTVELARANEALRQTADRLAGDPSIDSFLGFVLLEAALQLDAHAAHLTVYDAENELIRTAATVENGVLCDLPLDPMVSREQAKFLDILIRERKPQTFDVAADADLFWPSALAFHKSRGHKKILSVPILIGHNFYGHIGLAFANDNGPSGEKSALLNALCNQAALSIHLVRLSDEARKAAVAREREKSAQERAEDLSRANEAMRAGVDGLVRLQDLDLFLGQMLRSAAEAAGAHTGAVVLLDAERKCYRFAAVLERSGALAPSGSILLETIPVTEALEHWIARMMHSPDGWPLSPEDPIHAPETLAFHKAQGNRSLRHVPMVADGRLVGWLGLGFAAVEPPLAHKYALLRVLADQMTMAVEMLRLSEAAKTTAVAMEREKAAQERAAELNRANEILMSSVEAVASSADPNALLKHFLLEAMKVSGAQGGAFTLYEDGRYKDIPCLAQFGELVPDSIWRCEPFIIETPKVLGANIAGFFARLMQEQITRDTIAEAWNWWPAAAEYHQRSGHVEVWNVACVARGQVIASFGLGFATVPEMDSVASMLTALAQQAALALELHRLSEGSKRQAVLQEQQKAAQQQAAELVKANHALRSGVDDLVSQVTTEGLLTCLMQQAIQISGAKAGAILRNVGGTEFEYVQIYANGVTRSSAEILQAGTSDEMRRASRMDPTGHFRDVAAGNSRERYVDDPQLSQLLRRSTAFHTKEGNQLIYDVPYKTGDSVAGLLSLAFPQLQPPSEVIKETVKALATQVGLAIEFRRISEKMEQAAIDSERNKFARDLHDTLAQGFTGILMQLGAAEQSTGIPDSIRPYLARIEDLARTNLQAARRTVQELRHAAQPRELLEKRLGDLCRRLSFSYSQTVDFSSEAEQTNCPDEVAEELFLVAQEAIINALKHAKAESIAVVLKQNDDRIKLRVRDNGSGFSFERRIKPDHFGMQGMQERADRIGAALTIISEEGFGTEILATWIRPIDNPEIFTRSRIKGRA